MIKREMYMSRIRPFMNRDIVKVLTGIRRSGKSVMLELIHEELRLQGVAEGQILSVNLESKKDAYLSSIDGIYDNVRNFVSDSSGKVYLFFDEIQ